MSIHAISWAFRQQTGSPTRKVILIKLADNANDDGVCYPRQSTIARECELTRETVNRNIRGLESDGFLSIHHGKLTSYQLACDRESQGCDAESQHDVTDDHKGCDAESHMEPSFNRQLNRQGNHTPRARLRRPDFLEPEVWTDYLQHRKNLKAKLTATAWKRIETELLKGSEAGHDPNDLLAEAMANGWRGFKFEWIQNQQSRPGSTAAPQLGAFPND